MENQLYVIKSSHVTSVAIYMPKDSKLLHKTNSKNTFITTAFVLKYWGPKITIVLKFRQKLVQLCTFCTQVKSAILEYFRSNIQNVIFKARTAEEKQIVEKDNEQKVSCPTLW